MVEREIAPVDALMKEYGNDVLRTAYCYVKNEGTAREIFQQVYLKVFKNLDSFRNESSIKTWIIRITVNTCKDYLKSVHYRNTVEIDETMENTLAAPDPYEAIEKEQDNMPVRRAVMELPVKYRDVIVCLFYHQLSIKETATVLGLPEGTVKSRCSRAKEVLKVELERRGVR